jgi:hypothetical protein
MAVDTRDKRMSMLGLCRASVRLLKNPTGTIGATARAMVAFLYAGIPLGVAALPPVAVTRTFALVASRSTTFPQTGSRASATQVMIATRNTTVTLIASEV